MAKKATSRNAGRTNWDAQPDRYTRRYHFDMVEGAIRPSQEGQAIPAVLSNITFEQEGNQLVAHVPVLATGRYESRADASAAMSWDELDRVRSFEHNSDGKKDMRLAKLYWEIDPLVFKCTKVLTQLANSRISVSCEDSKVKDLVEKWINQAMPFSFRQEWFREFFRSGMVPVIKTLIPYVPRNYKSGKIPKPDDQDNNNINVDPTLVKASAGGPDPKTQRLIERQRRAEKEFKEAYLAYANAEEMHQKGLCSDKRLEKLRRTMAAKQHTWEMGMIPGAYTLLNPLSIEIKGPKGMSWLREPFLTIENDLRQAIANPTPTQKEVLEKLPVEIVQQIRAGGREVWLPPNLCTITYGDKQSYEKYPTPIAKHAFQALEVKQDLIKMDKATAQQLRERILLVKLGNDTYPCFDVNQIAQVAAIFNGQKSNHEITLFWNHTIELEWVQPDIKSLTDNTKYDVWDDEIRTAYGINKVFTGTEATGGSQGGDILNLKGVVEEVSEAQNKFLEFLNQEIRLLKTSLEISAEVTTSFDTLNIRDENEFMALIMQFVQNGIIDIQTGLETLGYHFPTIKSRMEMTKKLREQGLFLPMPSSNNLGPDGGIVNPNGTGKPRGKTGKASNNKSQKGKPKPKIKAAAKLVPVEGGEARLVIDADELDPDMAATAADWFGIKAEHIVTRADYEKVYGSIDMTPPLPHLSTTETFRAIHQGQQIVEAFKKEFESILADIRKPRSGQGKGQYVTRKRRAEARKQAWGKATEGVMPKVQPEWWRARFIESWKDFCEEVNFDEEVIQKALEFDGDPLDFMDDEAIEEMMKEYEGQYVETLAMATAVTAARFGRALGQGVVDNAA